MNTSLTRRATMAGIAVSTFGAATARAQPVKGGVLNVALFPEPPMAVSAFNSSTYVGLLSTKIG